LSTDAAPKTKDNSEGKYSAHLFMFLVPMFPAILYALYFGYGYEERQKVLEQEIRERYAEGVAKAHVNNEAMRELFQTVIKEPSDDPRIDQLLRAGVGDMKRIHSVDKDLYGTEEGKILREKFLEEQKAKRKKRKRKKTNAAAAESAVESGVSHQANPPFFQWPRLPEVDKKQVITAAVVGSIAAAVGFLAGGGNRRN
jgi:hypothetical protein